MMDPLLPTRRMHVAILRGDPVDLPVVQLLTLVQQILAVVGMHMFQPELQGLKALEQVRREYRKCPETDRQESRCVHHSPLRNTRGRPGRFPPPGELRSRGMPLRHSCGR